MNWKKLDRFPEVYDISEAKKNIEGLFYLFKYIHSIKSTSWRGRSPEGLLFIPVLIKDHRRRYL